MAKQKTDPKDLLKQGWIHILITFEVIGKPQKHVDQTLKAFLEQIKQNENIHWMEQHIGKAEKSEMKATNSDEQFFSAFAEVDMLVKSLETMTWLAMNYMPASIEVIEPTDLRFKALDLQNWQNDLLSKLHTVDGRFKQQASQLEYLRNNLVQLMHNTVLLSLARGPKKLPELAKETSVKAEALEPQLKKLIEQKRIKEKQGVYQLA